MSKKMLENANKKLDRDSSGRQMKLPTVECSMAQPFVSLALSHGLEVEKFLEPSGLCLKDVQRGEAFMAGQHWYDLIDNLAKALSNPHLGFDVGANAALNTLPNLSILETQSATLGDLLISLVVDVGRISSMANYNLETNGHVARLVAKRTFKPSSPPGQVDGYYLGFMVRLVRSVCDPDWDSKKLQFWVCKPDCIPDWQKKEISVRRTNRMGAHIEFPANWLLLRSGGGQSQNLPENFTGADDFLQQTRDLLELHLDKQPATLNWFAELYSQSPDRLKRTFRANGTSFKAELEKCRAKRAKTLLVNSQLSIKEIGESVGLLDQPSFHRSFKRWTGMTPNEFKKRNQICNSD
ncbi:helix-turn-helix domain-containing protein [Ruegeria sp. HKCCD7319]|nr:helix-turn-helix domain-containing protein [Ruegeria sp. HKCCD7319]